MKCGAESLTKTKKAIAGAEVQYVGQSGLSRQITDRDGRFGGYRFEPGPIQLQVKATGYKPGRSGRGPKG